MKGGESQVSTGTVVPEQVFTLDAGLCRVVLILI